ncbi:MAG TPA: MFS transporter [Ktedonobacteraceae bacterium]|nr:MFS transporter [Ktedonobacteraceae bacterium]
MSEIATSTSTSAHSTSRIPISYTRYVFFVMFAISFLNYLDRYMLSGSINIIAGELHFTVAEVGYISSAFLVIYTLGTLPLGIWADRAKRKNVVAISVAAWSLITALTALANSFATLFLTRMLLGIGEAGYFPAGTALMSDYFRRSVRSRVLSWWSIAQVFGILFGTALGGVLAGLYVGSWRLGFLITGIPGLFFAWLAWRLREPRRNQADEEAFEREPLPVQFAGREEAFPVQTDVEKEIVSTSSVQAQIGPSLRTKLLIIETFLASVWAQIRSLLRIKTLIVLTTMQIFAYFVVYVCVVFLSTYLQQQDSYHMTSAQAGIYSGGIIALAGMVGTIAGGYLSDLLGRRYAGARVLVCGIGFLIAAPSLAVTLLSGKLTLFTIFFVLSSILITIYQGPSTAALTDVVPARLRSTAICVSLLIAHLLGDAFSPTVVGVLASSFDPTNGEHFAQHVAGHDIAQALIVTCVPALVLAGLIGIFGSRWMGADVVAAERASAVAA